MKLLNMGIFNLNKSTETETVITKEQVQETIRDTIKTLSERSQPAYESAWSHFVTWCDKTYPGESLININTLKCEKYMELYSRRKGFSTRLGIDNINISKSTLRKISFILKSLYASLFDDLGVGRRNPWVTIVRKYSGQNSKPRRPTELTPYHKIKEFVNAPPYNTASGKRDRAVLSIIYGGALRRSEVEALTLGHVRILPNGACELILIDTKNGDDAIQELAPWAGPYVKEYYEQRLSEGAKLASPFVVGYFGTRHEAPSETPLCSGSMSVMFGFWRDKIGLPKNITMHSARATAITYLLDQGVPHREVRKFSRHSSIGMVEHYDKARDERRLSPANKVTFE